MTYVPPDGPIPAEFAVVGEAPAREELRQGRGFVGPSGRLLWPLMARLAYLHRTSCYVTNLSKTPVGAGDDAPKFTPEEFERCRADLIEELRAVRPRRILAVGAYAAKALVGDRYTSMDVCNGIGFVYDVGGANSIVVPTWHPAAALRPGGEEHLTYTAAAIAALHEPRMWPESGLAGNAITAHISPPPVTEWGRGSGSPAVHQLGIDTEGTPDDPICMTAATPWARWYIEPNDVPRWFAETPGTTELVFHNALWDWPVLWAMGAPRDLPQRWRWTDTMELAYLQQTEPRGLKALAYRHLGLRMRTFEEVVMPHWEAMIRAVAEGRISAGTTIETHSPKGRLLKTPKVVLTEAAKPLKRALNNPKLLAERLPGLPEPTLRLVPRAEAVEYATLDAWATVMLARILRSSQ